MLEEIVPIPRTWEVEELTITHLGHWNMSSSSIIQSGFCPSCSFH